MLFNVPRNNKSIFFCYIAIKSLVYLNSIRMCLTQSAQSIFFTIFLNGPNKNIHSN